MRKKLETSFSELYKREAKTDVPNSAFVPCDTKVKGSAMTSSSLVSYLLVYGRPELRELRARGKGHKDRLVPLPDLTLLGLRELWSRHRHPKLIFPNANGSLKTIQQATTHMDRGGAQKAMKIVVTECGIKKSLCTLPSPQFRHSSS